MNIDRETEEIVTIPEDTRVIAREDEKFENAEILRSNEEECVL